ncbi:MAG TPA: ATPase, T2SS/T4P/T4SS family, partial [Acidimicrobiia bacterium]|nr:ATPase, T2SS/T4P/T4SS family [Acidimicrobiia bacterium]
MAEAEEGDTLLPASDEAEDIAHRLEVVKLRTLGRRRDEPGPPSPVSFDLTPYLPAVTEAPFRDAFPEVDDVTIHRRRSVMDRPAGVTAANDVVTVKKSSERKSRKRFARRAPDQPAPGVPPAAPPPAPEKAAPEEAGPEAAAGSGSDPEGGPRHSGRPLGELLIGRGLVSEDQLREALSTQTDSGKRLGNILVELGLLSERVLVEVLAEQLQLEIVDLTKMDLEREVVTQLAEHDARRLIAVPVRREGAWLEVAVADPLRENLRDQLIELLSAPVRLVFATATDIDAVINKMHAPDVDLSDALRLFEAKLEKRKSAKETDQTVSTVVDENAPVVKVVNLILEQSVRERASDVHIEPMEDIVRVRVRTDGALHQVMTLPAQMGPSLISRIKVMSDMNIVERRKPQDGQLAANVAGRELDVRVSTTPTVFGEKCVLRVLDKTKAVIDLPGLGMSAETHGRYADLIRSPYGMVICAGPTGSGKTTTLYATLTAINSEDINVVTVEDPVEYVFPTINQIQINEASGLTFANGLRAILRQDP